MNNEIYTLGNIYTLFTRGELMKETPFHIPNSIDQRDKPEFEV